MQNVLIIAFHFPPLFGSSGIQRTLSFVRNLREGRKWNPIVLTAAPLAYPETSTSQLKDVPRDVVVCRTFALDAARHLSFRGKYPSVFALPDRWISWYPGILCSGLYLIRKYKPAVIWSTYPIATAHLATATLARMAGLPWVADFRDPMVERIANTWYPTDSWLRAARLFTEKRCAKVARKLVFCTETARNLVMERYEWLRKEECAVIPNGFDEPIFAEIESAAGRPSPAPHPLTLVHSGTLYPGSDRDPDHFFLAVATLKAEGIVSPERLHVILRGSGFDHVYSPRLSQLGIDDIVELAPATDYRQAIAEMFRADGLLLFQGYNSNPAIPAKLYEYLRVKRPILALVEHNGETGQLLRRLGYRTLTPLQDERAIANSLRSFLAHLDSAPSDLIPRFDTAVFSRQERTRELERAFDELTNCTH